MNEFTSFTQNCKHPTTTTWRRLEERGGGVESEATSCLYNNNSIENAENCLQSHELSAQSLLNSYHKSQAQTLYENVDRLVNKDAISINHVAFLTLTFQDNVKDPKEAYRRFRSFNTNFLSKHPEYGQWVNVKERQNRGAWHFHMIISLTTDIQTGFDFDLYDTWLDGPRKPGSFPTGNKDIHRLWAELAVSLEKYGFGRIFTLEPIKDKDAVGRYVGKYISKHLGQRDEEDKGVRLINYSKNWSIKNTVKRAWNTPNAKLWRQKLNLFALRVGCTEMYQLSEILGPGWAYKYAQEIFDITLGEVYEEKLGFVTHSTDYESPELKRIYANFEKAEKEITPGNPYGASRLASRKTAKRKIKSHLESSKVKEWICPEVTEFLANELQQERKEFPTRYAKQQKDAYERTIQAQEVISALNREPIHEKEDEIPF